MNADLKPAESRPSWAVTETARILVVEDDRSSRNALTDLLRLEGYEVHAAANGQEAIELFRSAPFDLVVSDVLMPRTDGFELLAHLREEPAGRDTPVILVSALDDTPRRVHGLDLGADDYVAKPVDADELLARVRVQLRRASRSKELRIDAIVDELTGVLNRRGVTEVLAREWKRADRTGSWLSALVVDLDDFKSVNDQHGHRSGDAVLAYVAQTLSRGIRAHDRVGRLGGDEFLIVLPETGPEEASSLAARIKQAVNTELTLQDGARVEVRLSVGAATACDGDAPPDLISRADTAMYRDKQRACSGRLPARRPLDR